MECAVDANALRDRIGEETARVSRNTNAPHVTALLINGRDAMLASLAGSVEETFRIANWLILDGPRKKKVMYPGSE